MSINDLHTAPDLLLRITEGNQTAFKALVDIYWAKVYGHALAYSKSLPIAEELTQDVFMDVWRTREKLGSIENFDNYLFIITRNRIFKVIRKKLEDTVGTDKVDLEEDMWIPNQQMEFREVYALVLKGIEEMPPVRRQVFSMSRLEGMSYEDISQQLNISRNTVKEHIVKALNFLRNYLAFHGSPLASLIALFLTMTLICL